MTFSRIASTVFMHHKIKVLCFDHTTCQGKTFPETRYTIFSFLTESWGLREFSLASCYRHKSNTDNRACWV